MLTFRGLWDGFGVTDRGAEMAFLEWILYCSLFSNPAIQKTRLKKSGYYTFQYQYFI
jgi:hypothetical protein